MTRLFAMLPVALFVSCASNPQAVRPDSRDPTAPVVATEIDAEKTFQIETLEIDFDSGGETLTGSFIRPLANRAVPAAIIVHDWGVRGRDGMIGELFGVRLPTEVPTYRAIAEGLAARGVAVLIFDKRTCVVDTEAWCAYPRDYVTGKPALGTALVDDVRAAAQWLKSRDDVASISLVGHGHGAEIAAVAGSDKLFQRVALLQPTVSTLTERATYQVEESIRQIDARIGAVGDTPEADLLKRQRAELQAILAAGDPMRFEADTAADLDQIHSRYLELIDRPGSDRFAILAGRDPGEPPGDAARLNELLGDRVVTIADLSRAMVSVHEDADPTIVADEVIARLSAFLGAGKGDRSNGRPAR